MIILLPFYPVVRYEVGLSIIHIFYGLLKQLKHNFARSTSVLTKQISKNALYTAIRRCKVRRGSGQSQLKERRPRSRSVSKPNSPIVVEPTSSQQNLVVCVLGEGSPKQMHLNYSTPYLIK